MPDVDFLIIGGGPAGLSAAIYALRAGHSALLLDPLGPGGQAARAAAVENYPGLPPTDGFSLVMQMAETAKALGLVIKRERAVSFDLPARAVFCASGAAFSGRALLLAMGARPRELGLPREQEFLGKGLSYCATCDGNFFRGRSVAVVGGGNTAVADARYLQNLCTTVYLIHRRETLRADVAETAGLDPEKVVRLLSRRVLALEGKDRLSALRLDDGTSLGVDGLFVAVGGVPNSEHLPSDLLEDGYVVTDERMQTAVPGVFCAGDLRKKNLRQIVTAAADGAIAAAAAF